MFIQLQAKDTRAARSWASGAEVSHAPSQRMLSDAAGHSNASTSPLPATVSRPGPVGLWGRSGRQRRQNAVASALSPWGGWNKFRQYLREWLYDGSDRARPCQTQLDVSLCFAPLLRWVLCWWHSERLALAVDPTLKGDQTTAIVISVLYRSCAIPVAWRIHKATQRGSWMDPTVELLKGLAPAVPREMTVIVLCDRGISSPKLWTQIRAQGWHPCMRYRKNITFCADGGKRLPARAFVSVPDTAWIGRGTAFGTPSAQRRCTLLVVWYASRKNPGSSSPIWHPIRRDPAGTPCASGSNWASRPSRAWAGSGTRPAAPTRLASPATGWCCRWPPCWPWPTAPGWRRPGPQHRPRQLAHAAQSPGFQSSRPSDPSCAHSQRNTPRHRLAAPVAAQGSPLEPGLAPARTLATAQAQPGDYAPCAVLKTPYIPLSAGAPPRRHVRIVPRRLRSSRRTRRSCPDRPGKAPAPGQFENVLLRQ